MKLRRGKPINGVAAVENPAVKRWDHWFGRVVCSHCAAKTLRELLSCGDRSFSRTIMSQCITWKSTIWLLQALVARSRLTI